MKNFNEIFYAAVFFTAVLFISCSQAGKEGKHQESETHQHESDEHEHGSGDSHHHDDAGEAATGESTIWTPSGQGTDVISSDFHFIAGGMEDINPEEEM